MNPTELGPSPATLTATAPPPAAHGPAGPGEQKHVCPGCAGKSEGSDRYVYAIGKLDVKFPTVGIEREFQQREGSLLAGKTASKNRGELLRQVLEANVHIAQRVCYLLYVGSVPAYLIAPSNASLRSDLLAAVEQISKPDSWLVVIGKCSGVTSPTSCGGILAPIVSCDQVYSFTQGEWFDSLKARLAPVLASRKVKAGEYRDTVYETFARIVNSAENIGGTDAHRALNYALVQHPGIFLACIERAERNVLDRIETRMIQGIGTRKLVAVILTFLERTTGVPERLFCRVDVTEEWPFLSGAQDGSSGPLGLLPFVENELIGLSF